MAVCHIVWCHYHSTFAGTSVCSAPSPTLAAAASTAAGAAGPLVDIHRSSVALSARGSAVHHL